MYIIDNSCAAALYIDIFLIALLWEIICFGYNGFRENILHIYGGGGGGGGGCFSCNHLFGKMHRLCVSIDRSTYYVGFWQPTEYKQIEMADKITMSNGKCNKVIESNLH